MGREQGRRRIHLLLYIAFIFSAAQLTVGCTHLIKRLEINDSLIKAREMMNQGDFQTALTENEKALIQPFQISKDRILFQRALIYSHPRNPVPDYALSEIYFQKVVDQFPDDSLGDIAEILILFLGQISAKAKENRILLDKIDRMEGVLSERHKAIHQHQKNFESLQKDVKKLYAKNGQMENALKKQQGEIDYCRNQSLSRKEKIDLLNSQIEELTSQIEKMKKIDLTIEQKKKNINIK